MQGVPFTQIGTDNNVPSGTPAETTWAGRTPNTQYRWVRPVSDGNQTVTGPTWSFTTAATGTPPTITTQPRVRRLRRQHGDYERRRDRDGPADVSVVWRNERRHDEPDFGGDGEQLHDADLTTRPATGCASRTRSASNSATATITVPSPPTITTSPASQTIRPDNGDAERRRDRHGPAHLSVVCRDERHDDESLSGATASGYTTPALTTTTSYWVRVTNAFGTANSATGRRSRSVSDPGITTQPQSRRLRQHNGESERRRHGHGLSYRWYYGHERHDDDPGRHQQRQLHHPCADHRDQLLGPRHESFGTANSNTAAITIGVGRRHHDTAGEPDDCVQHDGDAATGRRLDAAPGPGRRDVVDPDRVAGVDDHLYPVTLHGATLPGAVARHSACSSSRTRCRATVTERARTWDRPPGSTGARLSRPSGPETQRCTRPTGFSAVPPPGPAMPVIADPHVRAAAGAGHRRPGRPPPPRTPRRAVSISSVGTPTRSCLASLE